MHQIENTKWPNSFQKYIRKHVFDQYNQQKSIHEMNGQIYLPTPRINFSGLCLFCGRSLIQRNKGSPRKEKPVLIWALLKHWFTPSPLLRTFGHVEACIFRHKLDNYKNSQFDFRNGYFDNDYGQKWFLDGISMKTMEGIGEIW